MLIFGSVGIGPAPGFARVLVMVMPELGVSGLTSLGAEGVLPGRHIVNLLRVFKQFTHLIPSGQMLSSFKTYSPL